MNWLSFRGATRLVELLPGFEPKDRDLLERRALPPWLRRACRRDRRDEAIRELAAVYLQTLSLQTLSLPSGRGLASLIEGDCRRPPPPDDPRRPFADEILANSNRPPGFGTVRAVLAGLPRRPKPKPFTRVVVRPRRRARQP